MHIEGSLPLGLIPGRPSDEAYPSVYGVVSDELIPIGPGEVQAYVILTKNGADGEFLFKLPVFCALDTDPAKQEEIILNSAIQMACQGMVTVG